MGLLVLQAVSEKAKEIPSGLKPAIVGRVEQVRRNYAEITGQRKAPNFFYREAREDDYRRSLFQRNFSFYMAHGLANPVSGDLIEAEIRSWFDLRRRLQDCGLPSSRNLWEVQEETDALLHALRSSIVSGNRIEARFHLVNIQRNVEAMLRLCDGLQQPMALGAAR